MSSPATPTANVNTIADTVANAIPIIQTIIGVLAPEAIPAFTVASNVYKGLVAALPEAESLWTQIQSGTAPTDAQLQEYEAAELTAYDQVMADIQAKITASPSPAV